MNQLTGLLNDRMGKQVHKIIFLLPATEKEDKFFEVCQRYFDPRQRTVRVDKDHEFLVDPSAWVRQSKNKLIQYKAFNACYDQALYKAIETIAKIGDKEVPQNAQIQYFKDKIIAHPDGEIVSPREIAVNKVRDGVAAVTQGGQLQAGLLMLVMALGLGLAGGVLLGYLGVPVLTGQHLVPNG